VDFDMKSTEKQSGPGVWEFGLVNAALWFTAAGLGPVFFDPICYATCLGRRGSVALAACFSLAGSIGASQCTAWWHLLICRGIMGIGIGAKASIVPIWETEILPPAKRGRVLVSWQAFTAVGLLAGSFATLILRTSWRSQILSGGLPAAILLVLAYLGCESPRWLIVKNKHLKAFDTLVRLRKERILAAEEFCYIYFQIQTERAFSRRKKQPDFNTYEHREHYTGRIKRVLTLSRNRNAVVATAIVMIAQQLSGIK
jgi:MFS family permease